MRKTKPKISQDMFAKQLKEKKKVSIKYCFLKKN